MIIDLFNYLISRVPLVSIKQKEDVYTVNFVGVPEDRMEVYHNSFVDLGYRLLGESSRYFFKINLTKKVYSK